METIRCFRPNLGIGFNKNPRFGHGDSIVPLKVPPSRAHHRSPITLCCKAAPEAAAAAETTTTTFRENCGGRVPDHVLRRVEEIGFVRPTDVQRQSLPVLLSGRDCVLHAQTGSGKTLAYLLLVFSIVDVQRLAVQALIIVPTRELGMQVAKVARMLAAEPAERGMTHRPFTVMALLDGGMLKRHKSWLKAEPPQLVVATVGSLCRMLEKQFLKLETVQVLIIDEVDFMFNSSEQSYPLRKILTQYSTISNRQTVFASASIPQHRRFLYDCVQQKWTKDIIIFYHAFNFVYCLSCFIYFLQSCDKHEKLHVLLSLLQMDAPKSAIIFVNDQSELSKRAGDPPSATRVIEFLKTSYVGHLDVLLLEDDMNFNARVNALLEVRQRGCLLVATDIAGRGIDLPEMTHIYNYDLPRTATDYLHRAGRTARMPFSGEICCVTSIITPQERFVLQRFENELKFRCEVVHHPRKS
ncbi:hypothetical protein QJS04_geneDACA020658 [Acorus gramineus]|uniref:RNA helicase n=1 Tax=Acorus gramineus TaxID=55184 RepID=A0AAV9BWL3_ACOGR|nr:hypothetical protein QJS04_geneDACA020658 [Acorus gramineus]